MIKPYGDNILIELQSEYKHALGGEKRYGGTKKQGLCIAVSDLLNLDIGGKPSHPLLNKLVYFDEFEDSTKYKVDGKEYALIEIKNIRGYEE